MCHNNKCFRKIAWRMKICYEIINICHRLMTTAWNAENLNALNYDDWDDTRLYLHSFKCIDRCQPYKFVEKTRIVPSKSHFCCALETHAENWKIVGWNWIRWKMCAPKYCMFLQFSPLEMLTKQSMKKKKTCQTVVNKRERKRSITWIDDTTLECVRFLEWNFLFPFIIN